MRSPWDGEMGLEYGERGSLELRSGVARLAADSFRHRENRGQATKKRISASPRVRHVSCLDKDIQVARDRSQDHAIIIGIMM